MKAEMMNAAISQESPVSPGFQLNENDVQKIEGAVTGGAEGLMKIVPQVEKAVRSFKLFTGQMFSGLQRFYRADPQLQASAGEFAEAGIVPETENLSQEFRVQPRANADPHRGVADIFTNVGQKIGDLLAQQPEALAQQLGFNSSTISGMQRGTGQFGAGQSVVVNQSEPVVDTVNTTNISTQQLLGDSPKVNATHDQASGTVNALSQQIRNSIPKVDAAIAPVVGHINKLTQQLLGDSPKVNATHDQASGAVNTVSQQNFTSIPKIDSAVAQTLSSPAPSPLHDKQSLKKVAMPSLAGVMQNENVKVITDSLDYVKGKYGRGFVDVMRKLVKNPFLKSQNVIAGSSASQAEEPTLPTADVLLSSSAGLTEASSFVEPIVPAKQSIAATPVAKSPQGLDALTQKLLVNLQPGVNSLNQLVNQWPVGDSNQAMEQVGAISKSLQIEPKAILNLSNPAVVSGLMGELTVQDTSRYPYARDASLTLAQPAAASHNLNQTTTINVYGAAEPQVTANEIEARQTNIHSRLSQQLSGGPR